MSKGKRYDSEPKLNYKKVFAVIIALAVMIMFFIIIKSVLTNDNLFSKKKDTNYYTVYDDNKWGVINSKGESIVPNNYQEMIIIPDKEKDVFLCNYDINEQTQEYKTKALNKENKEIFTDYDKIEVLINNDENNNTWYEEDVLKVQKDGKYGLINLNGKEILKCEYNDIYVLKGIENSLIIVKDEKIGLANNSGSVIIDPEYKDIYCLGKKYTDGYITINQDGKYGITSYTKKQLLASEYEFIEKVPGDKYFVVKKDGTEKLVDTDGKIILELGDNTVVEIIEGNSEGLIIKNDNSYSVKNLLGEEIIDTKYQELRKLKDNYLVGKRDEKFGIIDLEENVKLSFDYTLIYYNKDADIYVAEDSEYISYIMDKDFNIKLIGILQEINSENKYIKMRVENEYKYFNLEFEEIENTEALKDNTIFLIKQDGKYGFVNKKGKTVVGAIYDDATEQNECGFAGIKKDGLWGVVNEKGEVILEPKYNLDANLIIDFIGKWHLGEDLNMNYYCEL